jgi:hypothetical protein
MLASGMTDRPRGKQKMSPNSLAALFAAYGGMLVMTVCLPFVASFLLDGMVQVLRNNGLKLFLGAVGLTVGVAVIGFLMWLYGTNNPPLASSTMDGMAMTARLLLTFSTALALIAFMSRTVKLLWKTRRAAA